MTVLFEKRRSILIAALALLSVLPTLNIFRYFASSFLFSTFHGIRTRLWPFIPPQTPTGCQQPRLRWDSNPICTSDISTPYCVYTLSSFNNHSGLAVFTTPPMAESLLSSLSLADHVFPTKTLFSTISIPSKGIGLVSKSDIPAFTPLLTSLPLAIFHPSPSLSAPEREHYLSRAPNTLPSLSRQFFLNLSYPATHPYNLFPINSILKHNSFDLNLPSPSGPIQHLAIYTTASRLNHDCAPNTQYSINTTTLTHSLHTIRRIPSGSELTISYISPLQPTAIRQSLLLDRFGFICTCSRCNNASRSDEALSEISDIQARLNVFMADVASRAPTEVKADVARLIELYEGDGLHAFMEMPYSYAANVYTLLNQVEEAKKYARLTARAMGISKGEGHDDAIRWREIADGR